MRYALFASLALAGCFSPDEPTCSFRCDDGVGNQRHCPDNYECRADGYCHLAGSTGSCNFVSFDLTGSADLAPPAGQDSGPQSDLLISRDFTMGTCSDGVKNGAETDTDCGGGNVTMCAPCADGKMCVLDGDCASGMCVASVCQPKPDLTMTPPDLTMAPPPDQATAPPPDLSVAPADLTMPPPDLAMPPPDLTIVPDMACVATNCTSPPPDTCTGNVRNVRPNPGTCDINGSCVYTPTTPMTCPNGCFGGTCTSAFSTLGNTSASSGGSNVPLATTGSNASSTGGGPASHTRSVAVSTITQPGGTVMSIELVWSLDPTFGAGGTHVPMTLMTPARNADLWVAVIPAQAMGVEVYFYIHATPYSGSQAYDPNGFGIHYAYAVN